MSVKKGCRYGLIIHGRTRPLCFDDKKDRDRVADYLKGLVIVSTMTLKKKEATYG